MVQAHTACLGLEPEMPSLPQGRGWSASHQAIRLTQREGLRLHTEKHRQNHP